MPPPAPVMVARPEAMPAISSGPSAPTPLPNSRCASTSSCGRSGTLDSVIFGSCAVPPTVSVATTLPLVLLATRRRAGSVMLPPLKRDRTLAEIERMTGKVEHAAPQIE